MAPGDLQEMLKRMVLKDEELDDVVLPKEEVMNLKEGARWMAVVKVHTERTSLTLCFVCLMSIYVIH
jgi:hypothetical protein